MKHQEVHEPTTYLRPADAAAYLGLALSTLAKLRMEGTGPRWSKATARAVIYRREDLDAWIASRAKSSTSEEVS